jgi:hypothetical protein
LALVLAISGITAPGAGQQIDREDSRRSAQGQVSARAHFAAAMEHYAARRYREAIHEFRLSIAALPSADVWFNIGRAHERLGESALAVEHYRLYLRDRVDAPDAAEVQQRIAELERHSREGRRPDAQAAGAPTGALAIEASEPDALVLLDGDKLGRSPLQRVVRVAAGRHRLEVSRPDYIPFRAEIEVQPGSLSAAYVELRPLAGPRAAQTARLWTWIAAGLSAGALLTSGALGVAALDRRDAGEWRDARRLAVASDVALGTGFGLAIGAAVLYFVEAAQDESPPIRAR